MNTPVSPSTVIASPVWFRFAVEGLSPALRLEVEPPGLPLRIVEPGGFRTDGAGRSAFEGAIAQFDELRRAFTAGETVARGADFPKEMA